MPKLKRLSGKEVILIFLNLGFTVIAQKGSHVKLRRIVSGQSQTLTIPKHDEIDTGTLKAIFRQATRYVQSDILVKDFYTE